MADCIDRDMLLKMISHKPSSPTTDREDRLIDGFISAVKNCPAAAVRPVVRGKWERMSDNDVFGDVHCKCSACGEDWWQGPGWFRNAHYCPNCGAMMEKS